MTAWQLKSGEYRRLFKGVWIHHEVPITEHVLAQAALLLCTSDAAASHHSAARIWGGIVPDDGLVHLIEAGNRREVAGIRSHRTAPSGERCRRVGGIKVVVPEQTFVDLARELSLVELVVLGDSFAKKGLVRPEGLISRAHDYRGNGCRALRRAASLVRDLVDSPMETRLRLLLVLAGLPEPAVNHQIHWPDGGVRFRFDLAYPEHKLIIEYDGRQHAESEQQWGSDLDRREWIDSNGWRIIVTRSTDLYNTPGRTLSRVVGAMRDVGMPVPRLSREWQRHFPSRAGDLPALG